MANITIVVGIVVVLSAVICITSALYDDGLLTSRVPKTDQQLWEEFKVEYKRYYISPEEEAMRREVFLKNVNVIRHINDKYEKGETGFTAAINELTDRTTQELRPPSSPDRMSFTFKNFPRD